MNDEKQVLKLAAERLLAVANGATLEWANGRDDGRDVDICIGHSVGLWGSDRVRIRPPAVAPEPRPSLPCPPRPTPEQVAAARMPDGRRVKEPTVCEVPNGRAWFADSSPRVYAGSKVPASEYGQRRWIAEPADEVVEPWTFATIPRPFPALHRWGGEYEIVAANPMVFVTIGGRGEGWGIVSHDWREMADFAQHNGQPCGVAK